jgi:hypothetical protein
MPDDFTCKRGAPPHSKTANDSSMSFFVQDILIDQDVWSHDGGEEVLKQGGSVIMTWKHLTEIDFSHNDIPYIDESVVSLETFGPGVGCSKVGQRLLQFKLGYMKV